MGQELSRETAAPCMVMERIDNDHSLALHLSELGDDRLPNQNAQYPQARILRKEYVAAQSGRQYAQLLTTMQAVGVITRGDRKATDFRWRPDGEGRLIVLDWNRAEHIDLAALDPTRFDESYIARRKAQLERGTLDDIRNLAHWWATFLLGRAVQGPLPGRDDPEPAWQALTLAMRAILLRGEAAGQPEGFASSNELAEALTQHLELLLLPVEELGRRILAEEWRRAPRPLDALLQLIDLAERRYASAQQLDDWRRLADGEQFDTLIYARQIVNRILTDLLPQRRWKEIAETVAKALRTIGPLSATNAAAYLLLHRWDIAARLDREPLSPGDADKWARLIATALQAMDGSTGGGWSAASDNLSGVASVAPGQTDALRPLRLEVELRQGGPSFEKWFKLNSLDERYADALRLSWPELNAELNFKARVGDRAAKIGDSRADLFAAIKALIGRYVSDASRGSLPPADRQAAEALRQIYQPLLAEFYTRASQYEGDGNEHKQWRALIQPLDALLAALQRGRLDDAAEFLGVAGRLDWAAEMDRLLMSARRVTIAGETLGDNILRRLLDLAPEGGVYRGEPRWPYELEQAAAAARKLAETGPAAIRPQARVLQMRLEQIQSEQDGLRGKLGADTAADWERFARRVIEPEDEAIDNALQEAMVARLEVWSPRPPAEDASDPDGSARALEAYRVRTLQALRAIQQLPDSLRTFSSKLVEEAAAIEARKPRLDEIAAFYRDYPRHLDTLAEQRRLVEQQAEALTQQRSRAEAERQQAEAARSAVEQANVELRNALTALKATQGLLGGQEVARPASHPALAALWVARSIDQAAGLDLDAAEKSLGLARQLLGQSQEPRPAPVGPQSYGQVQPAARPAPQEAPEPMSGSVAATVEMVANDLATLRAWQAESLGQGGMRRLDQLKQALAESDRYSAKLALEELKADTPNWRTNVILARLNERFEQLPLTPPPAPGGLPESGYSGASYPTTPGISGTSRPRLEPVAPPADRTFDDLIAGWREVNKEHPQGRAVLPFLPALVTRTDGFYRSANCSSQQKRELIALTRDAVQGMDTRSVLTTKVRALWRGIESSLAATSR